MNIQRLRSFVVRSHPQWNFPETMQFSDRKQFPELSQAHFRVEKTACP